MDVNDEDETIAEGSTRETQSKVENRSICGKETVEDPINHKAHTENQAHQRVIPEEAKKFLGRKKSPMASNRTR